MAFTPSHGIWGEESFSNSSGAVFSNEAQQGIVGGYVTLLPTSVRTVFYNEVWAPYSPWPISNRLQNRTSVLTDFSILGGIESPYVNGPITGYQRSYVTAGSWEIYTPPINGTGARYYQELQMVSDPGGSTYWTDAFDQGNEISTIEFDVACSYDPYSGISILQGFITGDENQQHLSPLSGVLSHGIYLKTNTVQEFVEVLPYGIRLSQHPEVAIPIDLSTPKRIRIAVTTTDIHLLTEDGKSASAYGLFDTPVIGNTGVLAFGAPQLSGELHELYTLGITGFAGHTYWSNIKLVNNALLLPGNVSTDPIFSTSSQTMYTAVFDPRQSITSFAGATVGFIPYHGGTTTVTAQYSGATGFIDSSAVLTLNGSSKSPDGLSLASIPIYTYPRANQTDNIIHNPIRFKITQTSTDGHGLPPAVDYIRIYTNSANSNLDIFPNWRPINQNVYTKLSVISGDFITSDPSADAYTNLLINVPGELGRVTRLTDSSKNGATLAVIGTGQIEQGGRFGFQYTNYTYISGTAYTGTPAATYLGTNQVTNFFPNPLFDEPFVPIESINGYVTGKLYGVLGAHLDIPTNFTGRATATYNKIAIVRPELQARENRLLGRIGASNLENNYLQNIDIPSFSTGIHDGTVGLELVIPRGIASGKMLAELSFRMPAGSGIYVYTSGGVTPRNWTLAGDQYRVFREISIPLTAINSGEVRIGFVVPSGYSLNSTYNFDIDNVSVSPIVTSYTTGANLSFDLHRTGTFLDKISISLGKDISKATTVFNTDAYIYNYPETPGIIAQCLQAADSKGFTLYLTPDGYLSGSVDTVTDAIASSSSAAGYLQSAGNHNIISAVKVPIGQLLNIGFIHQAYCYNLFNNASYTGGAIPENFASCNRGYLTINGQVVQSKDFASGWWHNYTFNGGLDSAPVSSFIPLTGKTLVALFSGIYGSFDGVKISRPPIADAETELSIKGARTTAPYFVPDVLFKPVSSSSITNYLYNSYSSSSTPGFGRDTFFGSIYNFTNPGFTNWDHGPWKNHLLFYGDIQKSTRSPYSGLGSTKFNTGSYAIAKYSSAYERMVNTDLNNQIDSFLDLEGQQANILDVKGWIYPESTGKIFSILGNEANFTGERAELYINTSNKLIVDRYSSANALLYSNTGYQISLNDWTFIGARFALGTTGVDITATAFISNTGVGWQTVNVGAGYGFRYKGHVGDTSTSCLMFAGNSSISLCDWALGSVTDAAPATMSTWYSGNKGGRFQNVLEFNTLNTGVSWNSFNEGVVLLSGSEVQDRIIWVAAHNAYDAIPRLNDGIQLYSSTLFKDVPAYSIGYNIAGLVNRFGDVNSPIKIGNTVPNEAINIARIDGQTFDVLGSVNTIDLGYNNSNNYTNYKDGEYRVVRNSGSISVSTATGITSNNPGTYLGRADVSFSGQVVSNNIEVTTIALTNKDLDNPTSAYYCYLLGRGDYLLYAPTTSPHNTGSLNINTTGSLVDAYIANTDIIRNSIKLKNNKGQVLDINDYPYDIVISPYSPSIYETAILSGININLNGKNLTGLSTGLLLNNGYYSVVLLTNKKTINDTDTVWAHYTSYNSTSHIINTAHKEIVNPIPIYRENNPYETPTYGRYSLLKDNNLDNYTLTVYGIESGISGSI